MPVALVAEFPSVLVIPPSLPVNTVAEFIAYAKANRGKLNYGGSLGTPPMLMGALFNKVADLGMTYVPYEGGAPSMPDLIAGRLHMQFDALTLLVPLIQEGKLQALAVQATKRWPDLPDVPTLSEAGFDDFPGNAWAGYGAAEDAAADRRQAQRHRQRDPENRRRPGRPRQTQRAAAARHAAGLLGLHRKRDAAVERDGEGVRRQGAVSRGLVAAAGPPIRGARGRPSLLWDSPTQPRGQTRPDSHETAEPFGNSCGPLATPSARWSG